MGITIPKLPWSILDSWISGSVSGTLSCPERIETPEWADWDEMYMNVAYRLPYDNPSIVMVEYKPKDGANAEFPYGYSRFYVLGADGKPVPYNERMWKELHTDTSTQSPSGYDVDSKGRATMHGRSIKATEASIVVEDLTAMNNLWGVYPNAKDYDTVIKLHEGQRAIDKLKSEDKYKWFGNQIKAAQESIKTEQVKIAQLESDLNKIYEEAADAMNYFEEQGIDPDMEDDGDSKVVETYCSIDFASMYPGIPPDSYGGNASFTGLTFKGNGTIMEIPDSCGQAQVFPDSGGNCFHPGDFIVDTCTGKQAVYGSDKKWYVLSA